MIRVVFAAVNVFASLVLGALVMGLVWYFWPDTIQSLFMWASGLKAWMVNRGLPAHYNIFLWFLIEERQLVYMGFVTVSRIVLAALVAVVAWAIARWNTRAPVSPEALG